MNINGGGGKQWVIIGVVVIVVAVVIGVFAFGNHAAAPTGQTQQNTRVKTYTSPTDDFAVNFPGTPVVTTSTFDSPTAGSIVITEYKEAASGGTANAYDTVFVYHYPVGYQFSGDYLSGALTTFTAAVDSKYPGTKIVSQSPTQFLGASALSATLTIPNAGNLYLVITTHGQNSYLVGTYGLSQSDYNAFVSSFTFTQ